MSSDLGVTIMGLGIALYDWLRDIIDSALHSPVFLGFVAVLFLARGLERVETRLKETNAILREMNGRLEGGRYLE